MSLTDALIACCVAVLMGFAVYHEAILPRRHGPTRLRVTLRRQHKLDSLIFIGLLLILLWNNVSHHGPQLTTSLLMVLSFMAFWLFWLRKPTLLMKNEGLFYAGVWIDYRRIQGMNLSEDGILVIQLEQRRLLIAVQQLDDLERIYNTLVDAR
ncbi:DUF986 family protein [Pantoea sp. B550]|uniref:DUF986 family protein n=1 Tax=Pantoea TaxID=53335 RepID=UPI001378DF64|nr:MULTISPECIES: DUF986 family protein [Pantoea]MCP1204716.1 DUF986 family protein [Pantoea sp. B550]MCT2417539.1 DUF986 family protein [Pantoea sp. XY16]NBB54536.1 DUF986 family protein [Pantoea vagans]QZX97195.1 DUF986 family protein [Pantoea alfalfae]WIL43595.1 DUF986 family protein [Pantoea agglomerans]